MPPKKKAPKMTADVAVDVLQKYIDKQNRPISVANMCDAHAAQGLGAAGAKKALDSLFSRGTVDMKLYGKSKYYLSKQSQYETPSPEEAAAWAEQFKDKEGELKRLLAQSKSDGSELQQLKKHVPDEELKAQSAAVQVEIEDMGRQLAQHKSGGAGAAAPLSNADLQAAKLRTTQMLKHWKRRKRACTNAVTAVADGKGQKRSKVEEDLGLETVDAISELVVEQLLAKTKP